jgi:hypothetical protein
MASAGLITPVGAAILLLAAAGVNVPLSTLASKTPVGVGATTTTVAGRAEGLPLAGGGSMPAVSEGACYFPQREAPAETAAIEAWFRAGGRGVDTAWNYNNQRVVGWALGNASADVRASLFVTTKIPCVASAAAAMQYIRSDLEQLGVSSVDMVLIHSPGYGRPPQGQPAGCWGHSPCCSSAAQLQDTWRGMEAALAANLTRCPMIPSFAASPRRSPVFPCVRCPMRYMYVYVCHYVIVGTSESPTAGWSICLTSMPPRACSRQSTRRRCMWGAMTMTPLRCAGAWGSCTRHTAHSGRGTARVRPFETHGQPRHHA